MSWTGCTCLSLGPMKVLLKQNQTKKYDKSILTKWWFCCSHGNAMNEDPFHLQPTNQINDYQSDNTTLSREKMAALGWWSGSPRPSKRSISGSSRRAVYHKHSKQTHMHTHRALAFWLTRLLRSSAQTLPLQSSINRSGENFFSSTPLSVDPFRASPFY